MKDSNLSKIEELKSIVNDNDEISKELFKDGFRLQIEWIDKIITLSISIISFTITVLLALKNQQEYSSFGGFFWMWLALASSALTSLIARFSYSRIKFIQYNSRKNRRDSAIFHHNTLVYIESMQSLPWDKNLKINKLPEKIDENIIPSSWINNVGVWLWIAHVSSILGIGLFAAGIFIFIFIGRALVS